MTTQSACVLTQKSVTFPSSAGFQGTCVSHSFYKILHDPRARSINQSPLQSVHPGCLDPGRALVHLAEILRLKILTSCRRTMCQPYHTGPMASSCTCRVKFGGPFESSSVGTTSSASMRRRWRLLRYCLSIAYRGSAGAINAKADRKDTRCRGR